MRMGVALGGASVRCPARMANTASRRDIPIFNRVGELFDLANATHDADLIVRLDGDASRIITAILELAQAFEQYVAYGSSAGVANDSAHIKPALSR